MARQKTRERKHIVEVPDTFSIDPAGIVESDFSLPWFVVMTAPQREFEAQFRLRMRGYRTWLPFTKIRKLEKVPLRDLKKAKTVRRALFPTYLFARVGENQDVAGINTCDHVSSIIYAGETPLVVPVSVMRSLVTMGDITGQIGKKDDVALPVWPAGASVRFKADHLFAGWAATVEYTTGGDVRVFIDSMRQALVTRADNLEPA
jgi:transcription antitermination factor NusG